MRKRSYTPYLRTFFKVILLGFIVFIPTVILISDIPDSRYSLIGDEYQFFSDARVVNEQGIRRMSDLFSQRGVYNVHPVADTLVQALSMRVFGSSLFGWKMTNVIILSLSIILVLSIAFVLFDSYPITLLSGTFFGFSHYLLGFAHIGYNNLHALIPFLAAILLFLLYEKTHRLVYIFLSGVLSGLCVYTFMTARLIYPLLALYILLRHTKNFLAWKLYFIGIVLPVIPFLWNNGLYAVKVMLDESISNSNFNGPNGKGILKFFESLVSSRAFEPEHYVVAPLIHPGLTLFSFFGIALLYKAKQRRATAVVLFTWFVLTTVPIIVTYHGIQNPFPLTRLHLMLPPLCIAAAYATVRVWKNWLFLVLLVTLYVFSELSMLMSPRAVTTFYPSVLHILNFSDTHEGIICVEKNMYSQWSEIYRLYARTISVYTDPYSDTHHCTYVVSSKRLSPEVYRHVAFSFYTPLRSYTNFYVHLNRTPNLCTDYDQ